MTKHLLNQHKHSSTSGTVMVITPSSSARTTPDSSYKFSMVLKPFTPIAWLMLVVASLMVRLRLMYQY